MTVRIEDSWLRELADVWDKDYFVRLTQFVRQEYRNGQVFPPGKQIFAAFDATPFNEVKVVILGQDPYHDVGQANGLCFSVNDWRTDSNKWRLEPLGTSRSIVTQLHTNCSGSSCRFSSKPWLGTFYRRSDSPSCQS